MTRRLVLAALLLGCSPQPAPQAAPAPIPAPTIEAPRFTGVPSDPLEIREWLQAYGYRTWIPQTELRATGEHGGERLYFNQLLAESWKAGASEHPVGSAAVRELYSADLQTLKGFAVMHKTGPSGDVGEGWYWFEIFGTGAEAKPTVAEHGARGCVGCHSHAVDFVHDPATPRVDPPPLL